MSKKFNLPHNSLNFVFHGGSGSTDAEIKESVGYGVIKMNIDTDTQWATRDGILQYYKANEAYLQGQLGNPKGADQPNKKYYDPRVWLRAASQHGDASGAGLQRSERGRRSVIFGTCCTMQKAPCGSLFVFSPAGRRRR